MSTLFQILSSNERIIVWSDAALGVIVTWNQSATLQMWAHSVIEEGSGWEECDIRTLSRNHVTFYEARKAAQAWTNE